MFASVVHLNEISTPTVGQLRAALEGLPDDAPVLVGLGPARAILGAGSYGYSDPASENANCVMIEEDYDD